MQIDVISDVVCPWCYIGKRKLDLALAEVAGEIPIDVRWRAFQLNPSIPEQGMDRREATAKKFGSEQRAKAIYQNIREAGEADGIAFQFEKIQRSPNTLNAHRVIGWAYNYDSACGNDSDTEVSAGNRVQHRLVEELFKQYFEMGKDLGDKQVLVAVAKEVGLDYQHIAQLLEREDDKSTVAAEYALAGEMGVSGVPCFIVNGKYMLMGAQDPQRLVRALRKIYAEEQGAEREGQTIDYPAYGSL